MKKLFILALSFCALTLKINAQTAAFGVIDTADLKMTSCPFEKGANAMVLFDKAEVTYKFSTIIMVRHKRIKIFSDKGLNEANIRIQYQGVHKDEVITILDGQTINLINGNIEVTPLDKKLIYEEKVDKDDLAKVFTFAKVRPGSVIEYEYKFETPYPYNYPDWNFQANIPTRYSEIKANFIREYILNIFDNVNQPFAIDTAQTIGSARSRHIWAMKDVPAYQDEPYRNSADDDFQRVYFRPAHRNRTWAKVGEYLLEDYDYGGQLNVSIDDEDVIIKKVGSISDDEGKVAYLFNMVKNTMAWNKVNRWYTKDGIKKAWKNKTGNSTEINLILFHLLKACGLSPSLMTFGTRSHALLNPGYPEIAGLNKTVAAITLSAAQTFILDASVKYNTYNNTPLSVLGLYVLTVDVDAKRFGFIKINNSKPSKQVVFVNADIKPGGMLKGTTQIINTNYNKASAVDRYNKSGEKQYLDELKSGNNEISVTSYKMRDMDIDSLPLREDLDFTAELTGGDEKYIYFAPNLFTGLGKNPFIAEQRFSDIDFIYPDNYTINGNYSIPAGYKIDALPKSMIFLMPDKSISFKRTIGEVDGAVVVHYIVDFKRSYYARDEYPEIKVFFKTMYEMLNEPVVLKKQ